MAQTSAILAHNQAILMQIQSHLGLPTTSPYVPARSVAVPPIAGPTPPPPASTDSLDVLATAAVASTPPVAPQPVQAEDDSSSATD